MSSRTGRVAELIEAYQGQDLEVHYLAYFECFNRQLYYEAHDVLEALWLVDKHTPNGAFYKGLIQLAGAFVAHCYCNERTNPLTANQIMPFVDFRRMATASL